jgi:hypothetical protein
VSADCEPSDPITQNLGVVRERDPRAVGEDSSGQSVRSRTDVAPTPTRESTTAVRPSRPNASVLHERLDRVVSNH